MSQIVKSIYLTTRYAINDAIGYTSISSTTKSKALESVALSTIIKPPCVNHNDSDVFCIPITTNDIPNFFLNNTNSNNNNTSSSTDNNSEIVSIIDTSKLLQLYHNAFLISPLFQLELLLLSFVTNNNNTLHKDHLYKVATGTETTMGPWTTTAVEYNTTNTITSTTTIDPTTTTITTTAIAETPHPPPHHNTVYNTSYHVMRSSIHGKPFCDTWWAVQCKTELLVDTNYNDINMNKEKSSVVRNTRFTGNNNDTSTVPSKTKMTWELLFGTALILPKTNTTKTTIQDKVDPWIIKLLMPFHLLYSRLLLSNAKATLVLLQQQEHNK